jgi:hypothetical protein
MLRDGLHPYCYAARLRSIQETQAAASETPAAASAATKRAPTTAAPPAPAKQASPTTPAAAASHSCCRRAGLAHKWSRWPCAEPGLLCQLLRLCFGGSH